MSPDEVRALLAEVRGGTVGVEEAAGQLGKVAELGFATLDLGRKDRCGFPEVVFAEGKTAEWVEAAVRRLSAAGQDAFATRISDAQAAHLAVHFPRRGAGPARPHVLAPRDRGPPAAGR